MSENKEEEVVDETKGQVVTPWEAKAGEGQANIDYDKLISKYVQSCRVYAGI